ncbi:MAG: hypothetical protein HZA54_16230, partial [Planctomycetes bacterium]|nr:hypothetical protein [Planctomycetota bacterium]
RWIKTPAQPAGPVESPFSILSHELDARGDEFDAILERVDAFLRQAPSPADAEEANRYRTRVEARREALRAIRLGELRDAAEAAIGREQYGDALMSLSAPPPGLDQPPWAARVRAEHDRALAAILERFALAAAALRSACGSSADFAAARAALHGWEQRLAAIEAAAPRVAAELAWVDEAERAHRVAQVEQEGRGRLEVSRALLESAVAQAERACLRFRFDQAAAVCNELEGRLEPEQLPARDRLRRELEAQRGAFDRLVERLGRMLGELAAAGAAPDRYPTLPAGGREKSGRMLEAGPEGLRVAGAEGGESAHVPWSAVPARSLYRLAASLLSPTEAAEHSDLGMFCLRRGLLEEADAEFRRAADLGAPTDAAQAYLAETAAGLEAAARDLLAKAQATVDGGDGGAALAHLLQLRNACGSSPVVAGQSARIEELTRRALAACRPEPGAAGAPRVFDWSAAAPPAAWSPAPESAWRVERGELTGHGAAGTLELRPDREVAEVCGLLRIASAEVRPVVQVRLGTFEIKFKETGAVYCADARGPRNTPVSTPADAWLLFRIWRERLPQGKTRVHLELDGQELTAFDTDGARRTFAIEFSARGMARAAAEPAGGWVRLGPILVRSEE